MMLVISLIVILNQNIEKNVAQARIVYDPTMEAKAGVQISAQLEYQYGLSKNEAIQRLVAEVGVSIVKCVDRREELEYTFRVLATKELNAYALPGGYIYITEGLLNFTSKDGTAETIDKDMLAGILGHEIAHIALRHHWLEGQIRATLMELVDERAIDAIINALQLEYESQADQYGAWYAMRAGYKFSGAIECFTKMLKEMGDYYWEKHNHPSNKDRISALEQFGLKLNEAARNFDVGVHLLKTCNYNDARLVFKVVKSAFPNSPEVLYNLAVCDHREYLASTAPGQFGDERFVPDYVDSFTWTLRGGPQDSNVALLQSAIDGYKAAIAADPEFAKAYGGLAIAYLQQGNLDEAFSNSAKAVSTNATDAVSDNAHGIALFRMKKYRQAAEWYEKAIAAVPNGIYVPAMFNKSLAYMKLGTAFGTVEQRRELELAKESWAYYLKVDRRGYWADKAWEYYNHVCEQLNVKPQEELKPAPGPKIDSVTVKRADTNLVIRIGDTAEDVIQKLGKPDGRLQTEDIEAWEYEADGMILQFSYEDLVLILLTDKRAPAVDSVSVGASLKQLQEAFGVPTEIYPSPRGNKVWFYPSIGVGFEINFDDTVILIHIAGPR
jgi:predicted Zn-dependent protease